MDNNPQEQVQNEEQILILPYTTDGGVLDKMLLVATPKTLAGETLTLLSAGTGEDGDADFLGEAQASLSSVGVDASDPDRWSYLGGRSFGVQTCYCFAVDITGVGRREPGKDSKTETAFSDCTVAQALSGGDGFVCAVFVQLFRFVFNLKDHDKLHKKRETPGGEVAGPAGQGGHGEVAFQAEEVPGGGPADTPPAPGGAGDGAPQ